jgi:hypothetical protein
MKRYLGLLFLTLVISAPAFGAACFPGGTLASYISQGSCTFTGSGQTYTLDNYTFVAVGLLANTATASDITVTASVGANGPAVTFTPDGNLDASGLLSSLTYLFGFDITVTSPSLAFASVQLSEQSTLTGLGSLGTVAEQDCYGGVLPVGILSLGSGGFACLGGGISVGTSIGLTPGGNANANANVIFTGFSSSVDVLKEIDLTAALGGSASVTGIGQSFTTEATPEPTTFLLGGCGLVALAMILRHRRRAGRVSSGHEAGR